MNDVTTKGRDHMSSTAVRTVVTEIIVTDTVTHLDASLEAVIEEYAQAKKDIKSLEAKKKAAEDKIRQAMGDAKIGFINGVQRAEIKDRATSKIDRELLQEAYPDAYTATLTKTEYTVLDAK